MSRCQLSSSHSCCDLSFHRALPKWSVRRLVPGHLVPTVEEFERRSRLKGDAKNRNIARGPGSQMSRRQLSVSRQNVMEFGTFEKRTFGTPTCDTWGLGTRAFGPHAVFLVSALPFKLDKPFHCWGQVLGIECPCANCPTLERSTLRAL
ncbi:hypothetical protein AB6A40_007186 [Gnathostoma spinigerum]|uniref:Uncharacterized protein n=1 Tax=Gnathostoma spinigerum TaxID=75299 RepID=A0ABD6EUW5_9BILA